MAQTYERESVMHWVLFLLLLILISFWPKLRSSNTCDNSTPAASETSPVDLTPAVQTINTEPTPCSRPTWQQRLEEVKACPTQLPPTKRRDNLLFKDRILRIQNAPEERCLVEEANEKSPQDLPVHVSADEAAVFHASTREVVANSGNTTQATNQGSANIEKERLQALSTSNVATGAAVFLRSTSTQDVKSGDTADALLHSSPDSQSRSIVDKTPAYSLPAGITASGAAVFSGSIPKQATPPEKDGNVFPEKLSVLPLSLNALDDHVAANIIIGTVKRIHSAKQQIIEAYGNRLGTPEGWQDLEQYEQNGLPLVQVYVDAAVRYVQEIAQWTYNQGRPHKMFREDVKALQLQGTEWDNLRLLVETGALYSKNNSGFAEGHRLLLEANSFFKSIADASIPVDTSQASAPVVHVGRSNPPMPNVDSTAPTQQPDEASSRPCAPISAAPSRPSAPVWATGLPKPQTPAKDTADPTHHTKKPARDASVFMPKPNTPKLALPPKHPSQRVLDARKRVPTQQPTPTTTGNAESSGQPMGSSSISAAPSQPSAPVFSSQLPKRTRDDDDDEPPRRQRMQDPQTAAAPSSVQAPQPRAAVSPSGRPIKSVRKSNNAAAKPSGNGTGATIPPGASQTSAPVLPVVLSNPLRGLDVSCAYDMLKRWRGELFGIGETSVHRNLCRKLNKAPYEYKDAGAWAGVANDEEFAALCTHLTQKFLCIQDWVCNGVGNPIEKDRVDNAKLIKDAGLTSSNFNWMHTAFDHG